GAGCGGRGQGRWRAPEEWPQEARARRPLLPARPPHRHQDRLRPRPRPGPAATPDLAQDDAEADRQLGPPVGGVQPRLAQEREQGIAMSPQVLGQALVGRVRLGREDQVGQLVDLDYWVVTRYHDIRHIFQPPRVFSAVTARAPLRPICPAAGDFLAAGGFRPIPTLTNIDPPGHSRLRRLANVAFTPRRVAAMEPFVRALTGRFLTERLSSGRADLVRDLAWDL